MAAKGLRAAVRRAFRHRTLVQRCQWHKREHVVSYLTKREQPVWRQRLQRAYNRPEYDEALAALQLLQHELEDRNQSAAGSLAEGLDETLTLHRLGVYGVAGPVAEDDERPSSPSTRSLRSAVRRSITGRTQVNASAGSPRRSWTSSRVYAR